MILAGLVVFEGIAQFIDPPARAGYKIIEPPAWIIPFQLVRRIAFTTLLLPVVCLFGGDTRETMVAVAVLFATLLASNMIIGYDSVPGLLWVALIFELFSQAFVWVSWPSGCCLGDTIRSRHFEAGLACGRRRLIQPTEVVVEAIQRSCGRYCPRYPWTGC